MQKIYLVEDDATIVSVLADYLRQWGYECYPAKKFAEILQEFRAVSPDLILLDISLPYYNGYHWCQEIRNISEDPSAVAPQLPIYPSTSPDVFIRRCHFSSNRKFAEK